MLTAGRMQSGTKTERCLDDDPPDITALCAEWQKRLRLQDWDVLALYASGRDLTTRWGECTWLMNTKQAVVRIRFPGDGPPEGFPPESPWTPSVEEILVHELLHLHFAPFTADDDDEDTALAQEQAINRIAQALVGLKQGKR